MMYNPNILDEGNQMEVIDNSKALITHDACDLIVRCNNCGQPIEYGKTRMCSGFVGCDNKMQINGKEVDCYFGDLMPRVMEYKESSNITLHNYYVTGKV